MEKHLTFWGWGNHRLNASCIICDGGLVYLWQQGVSLFTLHLLLFKLTTSLPNKNSHLQKNKMRAFSPNFEEIGLPFWVPGVLRQHSEVVLWKLLHIQLIFFFFFRWVCEEESGLPILFFHHFGTTPSLDLIRKCLSISVQFLSPVHIGCWTCPNDQRITFNLFALMCIRFALEGKIGTACHVLTQNMSWFSSRLALSQGLGTW